MSILLDSPPSKHRRTPLSSRLFTAADLAAMPKELPSGPVKYELDDGVLVAMSPPGYFHSRRQNRAATRLELLCENCGLGIACSQVAIVLRRNPDRVVGADAAFILAKSLPVALTPEGYLETIPELVVEVRSKNDTDAEVAGKTAEYLAAGVEVVWNIDGFRRVVASHCADGSVAITKYDEMLTCPILPGFAVPVAELFPD